MERTLEHYEATNNLVVIHVLFKAVVAVDYLEELHVKAHNEAQVRDRAGGGQHILALEVLEHREEHAAEKFERLLELIRVRQPVTLLGTL